MISALALAILLSACASGGRNVESWRVYSHQQSANATETGAPQAGAVRTVFYRVAADGALVAVQAPVNLYVNGHYQASLIGNSYTETFLCPGQVRLSVRDYDVNTRYESKQEGALYPVEAGRNVQYFEVFDAPAGLGIRAMAEPASLASLKKLQTHTISRVVPRICKAG